MAVRLLTPAQKQRMCLHPSLVECTVLARRKQMSNFLHIFSCKDLSMDNKLCAIGAYAVRGVFVTLAC